MELKQVVVVEMPEPIRRLPKATPCCRVCFEVETHQKLFVVEDLECDCSLYLHEVCVQEWFRIAGREVCPSCGQRWKVVDPCYRYEGCIANGFVIFILVILFILAIATLYQIITNLYMKS
jgi:hypothetical protein